MKGTREERMIIHGATAGDVNIRSKAQVGGLALAKKKV